MNSFARRAAWPGLLFCVLLLSAFSISLWGQSTASGTIAGTVLDQSGAVVPGATITLIDKATSVNRSATSNDKGAFVFVNVNPANYDIKITKQGFESALIRDQKVDVGKALTENVKLTIGAVTQEVTVETTGTELQTMNATVGNTVSSIALNSLPSLGRDVSTFATLQPGVSPDGSVAGTVVDQSSFQLDGGNNTNDMDGSMNVYTPSFAGDPTGGAVLGGGPTGVMPTPADSVEEFKVNTANQTADFNSSSGAQVQVVTKRGTNTWHGSAYDYYLDNNWNANTWQNNFTKTPIPGYHYSRFGASVGGTLLPKMLGGKTYFFANYQGFRWPNFTTFEMAVPTQNMRNGILTFNGTQYNIKSQFDPRNIGINPLISQMWSKYEPLPNDPGCSLSRCDGVNVQGFKGNLGIPQNDNIGVLRLDHDFGDKWHLMGSYRYYRLTRATNSQVDIGGFFPGDKLGVPASVSNRPQVPWYYVAGLTTNVSPNVTNDVHYSFLRNWWAWTDKEDVPQFAQLGGALEPFGESATSVLSPYNVNTQSTRTRFWDGQDHMLRDDVTWLRGNHLFNFGGQYQHNFNWHQRTDNGGGINYMPVYQLGTTSGGGIDVSSFRPSGLSTSQAKNWDRDYAAMLGIVSISQNAFTRTGNNLQLNPPHTPAFDQSVIHFYNFYASDSWHMRPNFTLTYGLGWTYETPPVERNGKQVEFVDANNKPIDAIAYLNARKNAALQGQVYNPQVGFSLISNTAGHPKYPYDPYYKEFSPRVAAAWNPNFSSDTWLGKIFGENKSVIRGGYGRIFGRLNGVDLVLVPLLGTGLIQPVQCIGPSISGACLGSGSANPTNAFRIGVDGNTAPLPTASATLPQPDFPGINAAEAGAGEALDPHFRPNVTDTFTLSFQRQLSQRMTMELGYIGRIIKHEYQPLNVNAVPYMMTLGGQSFAKAYAAVEMALGCNISTDACGANVPSKKTNPAGYTAFLNSLPKQAFFESAMVPGFCSGFSNCTAAVVDSELSNFESQAVWDLWSDLDGGSFKFPATMLNNTGQLSSGVGVNASVGYGNYNAGYFSLRMNDWHGLTMQQNFTWSKALGSGAEVQATSEYTADDPYNLSTMYGLQPWDRKFVYNTFLVYEPPFYKNQQGALGRILGGWRFSPIFTTGSGAPMPVYTVNGGGEAFGEGDSVNFFSNEVAVLTGPLGQSTSSIHYGVKGSNGIGTSGKGLNIFADPAAAWAKFRQPILGLDTHIGGYGNLRGMPYWNMDMAIHKNIRIAERVGLEFQTIFTNIFNHAQFQDPNGLFGVANLDTSNSASFGSSPGQPLDTSPRQMEFGLRVSF
jgi:carboxypeptidase family protein